MYKMIATVMLGVLVGVVGCTDNSAVLDSKASHPIVPSTDEVCKKPSNAALPTRC